MRAYARVGVREFWILNLEANVIEIFRAPEGERYADLSRAGVGQSLSPLAFADVVIAIDEILP